MQIWYIFLLIPFSYIKDIFTHKIFMLNYSVQIQTIPEFQQQSEHTFLSPSLVLQAAPLRLQPHSWPTCRLPRSSFPGTQAKGAAAVWDVLFLWERAEARSWWKFMLPQEAQTSHASHSLSGCSISHGRAQYRGCMILLESYALHCVFFI